MGRLSRVLLPAAIVGVLFVAEARASIGTGDEGADRASAAALGTLGTMSGANAYTTFVAMGAVADGWARKIYPADTAVDVVRFLRSLADAAAAGLEEVLASGALVEDDRAYLRGMIDAFSLLVAEADGFVAWVETGERTAFDTARGEAWKLMTKTMGLPEEEALE